MRILKFRGILCEEISRAKDPTVELRVLKDEDKGKCPHCGKPIETIYNLVENSPLFREEVEGVETISNINHK